MTGKRKPMTTKASVSQDHQRGAAGAQGRWWPLLALGTIYFVWGSTYLAIKVGAQSVAPLLLAAMRFLAAGLILLLWVTVRGEQWPRGREWASVALLGTLFFLIDYGLLFWAEQRVDSGVAAVIMATIPLFLALFEGVILRTVRFTGVLVSALALGTIGVGVLVGHSGWASQTVDMRG